mgnify:CR=1 FL=1
MVVSSVIVPLFLILFLLARRIKDVQAQPLGVEHEPVLGPGLLELGGNQPRILNLLELHVGLALLNGIADELGRARLTLGLDDHGLLLLPRLVDDESRALGLLLGHLLGLDGSRELGREGEMLSMYD